MIPLLALVLYVGCAAHVDHGLRRTEVRLVERALQEGDAATASHALAPLTVLGPDALPLLPWVLDRADRGDLEPDRLADALEAMGPSAVPSLEARLLAHPPWVDAGLRALSRLGPAGASALLRLSYDQQLDDDAFDQLRAMVAWAQHSWVEPGKRQRHPYLLPAAMFTPMDLSTQTAAIAARSCELIIVGRNPSRDRAFDVLRALGDLSCAVPWLHGTDPKLFLAAIDLLPREGPSLAPAVDAVTAALLSDLSGRPWAIDPLTRYLMRLPLEQGPAREAVPRLLVDAPPSVRASLIANTPLREPDPLLVDLVVQRLREDPDRLVRARAARRLCDWGVEDPEIVALLLRTAQDWGVDGRAPLDLRRLPATARAWLQQVALDHAQPLEQRVYAALSIPAPRPLAVETALYDGLQSRDGTLRALAMAGLVTGLEPTDQLPDPRREAAMRRGLQDESINVRLVAASCLLVEAQRGQIEPSSLRALRAALADPSPEVQKAARRALDLWELTGQDRDPARTPASQTRRVWAE